MDMESFKRDLHKALSKLPPGLIDLPAVAARIEKYRPQLESLVDGLIDDMKPHASALMMEAAMGILDKDATEKAVMEVLAGFGVKAPNGTPG